jgi:two-component system response regulator ResD
VGQILLLDDDPSVCELVPAMLAGEHTVTVAKDWTELSQQVFRKDFDLVLLDVNLPVVGGAKIAEVLQKTSAKPLKIILFSAMDEAPLRQLACSVGAAGYLVKTLERKTLRSSLNKLLALPAP